MILGKKESKAKGKICAWIYLFIILEESEKIITGKNNGKLIGFCGYAKWNSNNKKILKNPLTNICSFDIISILRGKRYV